MKWTCDSYEFREDGSIEPGLASDGTPTTWVDYDDVVHMKVSWYVQTKLPSRFQEAYQEAKWKLEAELSKLIVG